MVAAQEDVVDPLAPAEEGLAEAGDRAAVPDGSTDRRRPGRMENVSPHLIPLMRRGENGGDRTAAGGDLRPATGILAGAGLGLIMWSLIALAAKHFLFD